MNNQSMGAVLILGGLGLLWAIWADRSPFRSALWGTAGAPGRPEERTPAESAAEGFWREFWRRIPGAGLLPGSPGAPPATAPAGP